MRPFSVQEKLSLINRAKSGEKVAKLCRKAKISRKTFYQWLKKYNSTKPNLAIYKLADHRFKKNFSHKSVHWKDKLLIVNKHLAKEDTAVEICRNFNVSRKSLYAWLKNYQKNGEAGLYEMRSRGEDHYKYLTKDKQELILYTVAQHPQFSVHTLSKTLSVGHHGIQNLLERKGLSTQESRKIFAEGYITTPKTKVSPLYEPQIPIYRLRQIIAPFTTIPKLFLQNPRKGIIPLVFSFLPFLIFFFWIKLLIFAPTGTSEIGLFFATISLSFGVVFFLYSLKYYLSMIMVLKLANSGLSGSQKPRVTNKLERLISKFWHHKKPAINPLLLNFEKITLQTKPFVSIHVAVYNEKNVIERLIRATTGQDWFVSANSSTPGESKPTPGVSLGGNPERSRRVNYEVVIVDDSTDGTTEIAKKSLIDNGWLLSTSSHPGVATTVLEGTDRIGSQTSVQERDSIAEFTLERSEGLQNDRGIDQNDRGIDTSVFTKSGGPTVRLIHRSSRFGFKGGALQRALEQTDPVAEYVVVFDADFVPYADTIEQFMKAFQVLRTGTKGTKSTTGITGNEKASGTFGTFDTFGTSNIAAIQGYQWHVLNKSQTWVTRGVRTEYAGSYVIERSSEEIYGGLKQIAGAVYAIRADVLRKFGWGKSITEDFELTLRLYEAGYKVSFIPYIQAPAEAVSTIKRLIRQRMRWAEGASFNIKVMLKRMLFGRWEKTDSHPGVATTVLEGTDRIGSKLVRDSIGPSGLQNDKEGKVWIPSRLSFAEKLEFVYLAPYYLQAAFFVVGTLSWFISEAVFHSPLPFWTSAFGWSLVFTNLLSLPLMNIIGLFLEESDERDYLGVFSFVALSYIVVPFQAYAAVKGFLEREEGPWFRTPKTGLITDVFSRSTFAKFFGNIFGRPAGVPMTADLKRISTDISVNQPSIGGNQKFAFASALRLNSVPSAYHNFNAGFGNQAAHTPTPKLRFVPRTILAILLILTLSVNYFAFSVPQTEATNRGADYGQYTDVFCPANDGADCKISYFDVTNGDLRMADCDNATCSSGNDRAVDETAIVGSDTSIYCISSTDCKISYFEGGGTNALNFADCDNTTCDSKTLTTVVPGSVNEKQTGVYCIDSTDCKISYQDSAFDDLKMADCNDATCSTVTRTTVDSLNTVGQYSSIYCPANDGADCKISYYDVTNTALKMADCSNPTCSTKTLTTVDNTENDGKYSSIYCIDSTDCKISYYDATNQQPKFADCNNATCSTNTLTTLTDATNDSGYYTSIYCLASTDCKVAYYDATNGVLKMVDCGDSDCTSGNRTLTVLDGVNCILTSCSTTSNVGQYTSIYCPATDDCKISYYDVTSGDLKFVDCANAACNSGSVNSVALTVPEFIGFLIPVAPFLPKIVRKIKARLKRARKAKKSWRPKI